MSFVVQENKFDLWFVCFFENARTKERQTVRFEALQSLIDQKKQQLMTTVP